MNSRGARSRWLRAAQFVLFLAQFALMDVALRGTASYRHGAHALFGVLASAALWALLSLLARTRALRAGLALAVASLVVLELVCFRYYHSFLDDSAVATARLMWSDVEPVVVAGLPGAALVASCFALFEYALLTRAPQVTRFRILGLCFALGIGLAFGPSLAEAASPDLQALRSLRIFWRAQPSKTAAAVAIPPFVSRRARLPNVLVILTESVRVSDHSRLTYPATLKLVPERVEFAEMRSVASYTAIAVNALLSGRVPLGTRAEVAATPLVFDFVRAIESAAGHPRILYWSAQDAALFERANVRSSIDSFVTDATLLGHAVDAPEDVIDLGLDGKLAEYASRELRRVPRPFFLIAHLSGTHAPYFVDERAAPFRPYRHSAIWSGLSELHNAYLDAILAQDRSVAEILRAFFASVGSEPYFVLFTSDHGEAFGEHAAIHHGQSLYDEQIHVPAWIAHGNGALTSAEDLRLRSHRTHFSTHLDILPTLLDAYGIFDTFAMLPYRQLLVGRSLLRPFSAAPAPIPVTNCTELFSCPLKNYGLLAEDRLLTAQPWDDDWRCVDPRHAERLLPSTQGACGILREHSRQYWPTLPGGQPNR